MRDRMAMYNDNALKIGLFGSNCSSGRAVTLGAGALDRQLGGQSRARPDVPTTRGIEFMLPVGRWKGYGGDTDYMGTTLETITWATGLLAHTKRLIVFGTVHAPLFHPLIAAKQFVTADHVSQGRFGLNIVVGWNEDEFQMFGVTQRDHEQRYDYAQEWIDAVKMAWGPKDDFDYDGQFIKLKNVRAKPKPYGGTRPLIMNAGASRDRPRLRHPQLRRLLHPGRPHLDGHDRRQGEGGQGRGHGAGQGARRLCGRRRHLPADAEGGRGVLPLRHHRERRLVGGRRHPRQEEHLGRDRRRGGVPEAAPPLRPRHGRPADGRRPGPDRADSSRDLHQAGLRGIGFSFVNYLKELPYFCDEVLPRLERMGIRAKRKAALARRGRISGAREARPESMATLARAPLDDASRAMPSDDARRLNRASSRPP